MQQPEMTEARWLACADPERMLHFLRGQVSRRKWTLFAVACCRRLAVLPDDRRLYNALATSERLADGQGWQVEELVARNAANQARAELFPSLVDRPPGKLAVYAVSAAVWADFNGALYTTKVAAEAGGAAELPAQAALIREVMGNPFRPVTADPAWLARHDRLVPRLARAVYEDRSLPAGTLAADRLAVLADALEDVGCNDPEILSHCRSPGPHPRGCWLVDRLLEKG